MHAKYSLVKVAGILGGLLHTIMAQLLDMPLKTIAQKGCKQKEHELF
jgi:hypothetical protein